jgi:hypothetical protein
MYSVKYIYSCFVGNIRILHGTFYCVPCKKHGKMLFTFCRNQGGVACPGFNSEGSLVDVLLTQAHRETFSVLHRRQWGHWGALIDSIRPSAIFPKDG